jgi:hypothetical protein
MQKITTVTSLKAAIEQLEISQANEWALLKEQFFATGEALKPAKVLSQILSTPDVKSSLVNAVFGITAGLATTKLFMGRAQNPILKLLVGALMGVATSAGTLKAASGIKSAGISILKKIFRRNSSEVDHGRVS